MKKILGISAFYHDSAAALVVDGKIIAAAQEERFTRIKHSSQFPLQSICYCLEEGGVTIDELDAVVFYDKPLLKFERLLQTYYAFAPKGLLSFLKAIPVWLDEKLFMKKKIYDGLSQVGTYQKKKLRLLFTPHHLSHAASAYYPSPYQKAAVLTIDGVGEWCTASIGIGEGSSLSLIRSMHFPHSVGLLYSAFTYYLGFTVNSGEYKLMGLAPYGNPQSAETVQFKELIENELIHIYPDGSIWLNQYYFQYATGLRMVHKRRWEKLFRIKRREPEAELLPAYCNLALAIQQVTEEIVLKMAAEAKRLTGASFCCLAGGVALNCVANGKLQRAGIFDDIFIQPAAGDAGGALGAALTIYYQYFAQQRIIGDESDQQEGSYLGPFYSDKEVVLAAKRAKGVYEHYVSDQALYDQVSGLLAKGKVVGWFQGRMEFGPRALGNRSILGDPRDPDMQKKLNLKIKHREGFRPFAPAVLAEDANHFFELEGESPYMLIVASLREAHRKSLPADFQQLSLWERLYFPRSELQAITHLDFSARVQTVHASTNPKFYHLLQSFKSKTGVGVLVNTSFNVRGEPIVCTPADAYRCFMSTDMDALVLNNFLFIKEEQPDFANKEKWMINFEKD
ncbi:MAG: carbamoyltransferase [Bacteroidetes bacterium]|nr:carbamoyltransferase [Bacteroidota bacterium]